MSKTLVAYFSREGDNYQDGKIVYLTKGNTEVLAQAVAEATEGKLFRIRPLVKYPNDYAACTQQARNELDTNARPALAELPEDINDYDFIFLGYPIWWQTLPMPVCTFLTSYDFTGKYIYPFCTHEGGLMGSSEEAIRSLCPGAKVSRGLPVRGNDVASSRQYVESWLRGLSTCFN